MDKIYIKNFSLIGILLSPPKSEQDHEQKEELALVGTLRYKESILQQMVGRRENKWWGLSVFSPGPPNCFLPKMKRKLKGENGLLNGQKCLCLVPFSFFLISWVVGGHVAFFFFFFLDVAFFFLGAMGVIVILLFFF